MAKDKKEVKSKVNTELQAGKEDEFEKETKESKNKGNDMIEVSAEDLRDLIKSNKELKEKVDRLDSNAVAQSPNLQVRKKQRDFDYFVRKWENKIVLGFVNKGTEKRPLFVYNIYNKETRAQEQFIDLILKDEKGNNTSIEEKVDYIVFLRDAEKVKARMLKKEEKEDVKEFGMIPKKEMAENGYGMYETMVMVPVEVVSKTYVMTLKLPEDEGGEEIVMSSDWLNL